MAKLHVLIFGVIAATVGLVSAITDDEKNAFRTAIIPTLEKCGKEFSITKEDIVAAKEAKNSNALDSCFYACVLKDIGTMNDQGLYDTTAAKETHKKYIHAEEDVTKLDAITDICSSVNDQTVDDGPKGCQRAKLVVDCLITNKASFSPLSE